MFSLFSKKKNQKGQGLVEYALILVLVAIVVIAALMILGPSVGNIFSKVNSSISGLAAPTATAVPPAAWTFCANENSFCSFSGTAPVRYGANGIWVTLTKTNGTPCTNAVFGDPIYGTFKSCQVFQ